MRLAPLARWGKAPTDPAQLARWNTPRTSLTPAEYADPFEHYRRERAWRICHRFAAGLLVGVVLALLTGVL